MQMHELWNSVEKLGSLITLANWGIAASLLLGFACTAAVIVAGNRKDNLVAAENVRAAEHVAKLDAANLNLRKEVAMLETLSVGAQKNVAALQKAALDAKAAQQAVELQLEAQKEQTAKAQTTLLKLQERVKLRHLSAEQRKKLIDFLTSPDSSSVTKGPISFHRLLLDETA